MTDDEDEDEDDVDDVDVNNEVLETLVVDVSVMVVNGGGVVVGGSRQ